jgi:hypothetical protein
MIKELEYHVSTNFVQRVSWKINGTRQGWPDLAILGCAGLGVAEIG